MPRLEREILASIKAKRTTELEYLLSCTYFKELDLSNGLLNSGDLIFLTEILEDHPHHNVESILLTNNNIGNQDIQYLVQMLIKNPQIVYLDLSHTGIDDAVAYRLIDSLHETLVTTHINLSDNPVSEELKEIIKTIQEENINAKSISIAAEEHDLSSLTSMIKGTVVDLKSQQANTFLALAKLLSTYDGKITHLKVTGIVYQEDEDEDEDEKAELSLAIAEILHQHPEIINLSLIENELAYQGLQIILKALGSNQGLRVLELSNNNFGVEGARILADFLKNHEQMIALDLVGNRMEDEGVSAIAQALYGNKEIKRLYVGNNQLSCEGIQHIIKLFSIENNIAALDLSYTNINYQTMCSLIEALKVGCCSLKALELYQCQIDQDALQVLSAYLATFHGLTSLDLRNNGVELGIPAFINMLTVNRSIKNLYIGGNIIGQSITQLVNALKCNPVLVNLDLSQSDLTNEDIIMLSEALTDNISLKRLELAQNRFSNEGLKHLFNMLQKNKVVSIIGLEDNAGLREVNLAKLKISLNNNYRPYQTKAFSLLLPTLQKDIKDLIFDFIGVQGIPGLVLPPHDLILKAFMRKTSIKSDPLVEFAKLLREIHHMSVYNVPADGNCFFHAVADQLKRINGNHPMTYEELKKFAIQYIAANPEQYKGFLIDKSVEQYVEEMMQDSQWADQNIIHALAHQLGINIVIIGNNAIDAPIIIGSEAFTTTIYLGHLAEVHYVSLHPLYEANANEPSLNLEVSEELCLPQEEPEGLFAPILGDSPASTLM